MQWAVRLLEKALPVMGVGTEVGKDIMKALTTLSKHVPPGATSAGVENSALSQMMMQQRQEAPMLALMRAQAAKGAAPGGAPAAPQQAAA